MTNTSITFRHSLWDKILLGFGTIFFASLAYVAWVNQFGYKNRMVIALLAFGVLCLIGFLGTLYTVTVTEKEIIVWDMFRVHRLAWNDIYEVIPSRYPDSFSLSDRNRDVKVYISSQVKGYLALVGIIRQLRPDIWRIGDTQTIEDIDTFHQNPWAAVYYGLGSVAMIAASFFIPSSGNPTTDLLGKIMAWFLGISGLIIVAQLQRKLEFQGNRLIISYYGGWKKDIQADEVIAVSIHRENTRGGVVNLLELNLDTGKKITLSGYKEGMPMLMSALEKWMIRNKTNRDPDPQPR